MKKIKMLLMKLFLSKWAILLISIINSIVMIVRSGDYYYPIGLTIIILWIYLLIIKTANIKRYLLISFLSLLLYHISLILNWLFFVEVIDGAPDGRGMVLIFNYIYQPFIIIPFLIMVVRISTEVFITPWIKIILVLIITSPIFYFYILYIIGSVFPLN